MSTLKDRITALSAARPDISKADIARAAGVKPPSVNAWFTGETKSLKGNPAAKVAALFGCEVIWLTSGVGPAMKPTVGSVDAPGDNGNHSGPPLAGLQLDNIRPVEQRKGIPLISWVQAGMFAEVQDNFLVGEADDWMVPLYSRPGPRAFALRVKNDSMVSPYPNTVSFPEDTVIACDPDIGFTAGSFVIAKDVHSQKATFKKLVTDAGNWFLKPLNPAYPTIQIDDPNVRVIATVTEFQPPGGKLL